MKSLLSADELIQHMKSKGITFHEVTEADAKEFLLKNNYYMKLASYRANYEKNDLGKRIGQYKKLDFGYLQELSTIDMHLRYIVMEMCLDIEHAIKVKLISEVTNNSNEDGYEIVKKFLSVDNNINILKNIRGHKSGQYCKDLIEKYYPFFPVWVFVELISFGNLMYLCTFYKQLYGVTIINNKLMNTIRDIRNAAAHSNCLINKMTERLDATKQPNSEITNFVRSMPDISASSRAKNLNYTFTYSFITLIYVYDQLMPESAKKKRFRQLKEFMECRMIRNKDYFKSNTKIIGVYNFHKKVIDNLV